MHKVDGKVAFVAQNRRCSVCVSGERPSSGGAEAEAGGSWVVGSFSVDECDDSALLDRVEPLAFCPSGSHRSSDPDSEVSPGSEVSTRRLPFLERCTRQLSLEGRWVLVW